MILFETILSEILMEAYAESGLLRQNGHNNFVAAFRNRIENTVIKTGLFHDIDIVEETTGQSFKQDEWDYGWVDVTDGKFYSTEQLDKKLDIENDPKWQSLWSPDTEHENRYWSGLSSAGRLEYVR